MTELASILEKAEDELRSTGSLTSITSGRYRDAGSAIPRDVEAAFAFLGCASPPDGASDDPLSSDLRARMVRLMFLKLGAQTSEPRWSSRVLDALVEACLRPAGAQIDDVVRALFGLLAESRDALSATQVKFIRDVGVQVVGRHRREYAAADFSWLASSLVATPVTSAQAYLAAYTLPTKFVPSCRQAIFDALRSTPLLAEVEGTLSD